VPDLFVEMYTDLPGAGEEGAEHADDRLDRILAEDLNVVYVLLENDDDLKRMREIAIGVAAAKPNMRRVVEADPAVLAPERVKEIRQGKKQIVGAVYGPDDAVAVRLRVGDALSKLKVIAAFAKAETKFAP
jgi:hypothetical protein